MNRFFISGIFAFALMGNGCTAAPAINNFTSDGCSLFPDGTLKAKALWCDCCFKHDLAYWRGGSNSERKQADRELRACVLDHTENSVLAETMYKGVRSGGGPVFPTWYRWGYGWQYGRGYQVLTEQEQKQVADKLEIYQASHPQGYCRQR